MAESTKTPTDTKTAKSVYLIRHAKHSRDSNGDLWQIHAELEPKAEEKVAALARYFGERDISFALLKHSPLKRAIQTAELLKKYAGITAELELLPRLGPAKVKAWNQRWKGMKLMEPTIEENAAITWTIEFNNRWPDLCELEGKRVFRGVSEIAHKLRPGENAAAISHNPLIAYAQAHVTEVLGGPELSYCQFMKFTFDEKNVFRTCEAYHAV